MLAAKIDSFNDVCADSGWFSFLDSRLRVGGRGLLRRFGNILERIRRRRRFLLRLG